jgi:hypothetical protein
MKRYKERMGSLPDRFLEVILLDMSEVGIIQNYRARLQDKQKEKRAGEMEEINLEVPNLEDFYVGKFSRLSGLSHLDMRYLAQLGLKTFATIIKKKHGYFEVETNSEPGKRRVIYFWNIKDIRPDRGKWFDDGVQKSIGDGTHYDILLPVSEVLIQDEEVAKTTYEVKSFIELFERWLHSEDEKEPLITDFSDFEDFSVIAYPRKDEYVEKIGEKIVDHYQKNKGSSALSVDFEQVRRKFIDFSTIIKILSYVQLAKNINHIIIYNLDQDSFGQMMNQLRILAGFEKFWNNHSWLYLYDENGVPFIINGEDAAACDRLNKMVELHYGYFYTIFDESTYASPIHTEEHKILPYELLINTTYKSQILVSLFEKNVYFILEKEIEGIDLGLKIKDAHMRLGSIIVLTRIPPREIARTALTGQDYADAFFRKDRFNDELSLLVFTAHSLLTTFRLRMQEGLDGVIYDKIVAVLEYLERGNKAVISKIKDVEIILKGGFDSVETQLRLILNALFAHMKDEDKNKILEEFSLELNQALGDEKFKKIKKILQKQSLKKDFKNCINKGANADFVEYLLRVFEELSDSGVLAGIPFVKFIGYGLNTVLKIMSK